MPVARTNERASPSVTSKCAVKLPCNFAEYVKKKQVDVAEFLSSSLSSSTSTSCDVDAYDTHKKTLAISLRFLRASYMRIYRHLKIVSTYLLLPIFLYFFTYTDLRNVEFLQTSKYSFFKSFPYCNRYD